MINGRLETLLGVIFLTVLLSEILLARLAWCERFTSLSSRSLESRASTLLFATNLLSGTGFGGTIEGRVGVSVEGFVFFLTVLLLDGFLARLALGELFTAFSFRSLERRLSTLLFPNNILSGTGFGGTVEGVVGVSLVGWMVFLPDRRVRRCRYGVSERVAVVMFSGLTRRLARETEANAKDLTGHI